MIHSPFRVQECVASLRCALLCLSAACVTCLQVSTDGLHAPFAVVRPFWENDLAKIFDSYRDDGSPRACVNHTLPADLVLYFAGPPIDLSRLVELASRDECFEKVRVEFAHLGADLAYPAAPCKQFVGMYEQEPPVWGYDAILVMEHDMRPLRGGWLEELLPRLKEAARGDSWMTGGTYDPTCMYKISDSPRSEWPWPEKHPHTIAGSAQHINGNAIYTAAQPWSDLVRQHSDRCLKEPAWDFWLFYRSRRSENSKKWRSDKRFLDCKSVDLNSITMPHNRIISANPEALFIHANPGVELNITDIPLGLYKKITDSKDSDEYPVFWHIPRAAGITVEFHVKDRFNLSQMIWHEDPAKSDGGDWHIHWPKTAAPQQGRPLNLYRGEIGVVSTKSLGVLHHLLNARARGRLFTVLRHPIERFVSQFYALRARPEHHVVKNFTLAGFADSEHMDEDWVTSALSDLVMRQPDLEMAKRFLRDYVIVGLSSRLGESMKRFQTFFDWQDIKKSLGARTYQLNRRLKPHPQLLSTDAAWAKLERRLSYDMELYQYGRQLFDEQGKMFAELQQDAEDPNADLDQMAEEQRPAADREDQERPPDTDRDAEGPHLAADQQAGDQETGDQSPDLIQDVEGRYPGEPPLDQTKTDSAAGQQAGDQEAEPQGPDQSQDGEGRYPDEPPIDQTSTD